MEPFGVALFGAAVTTVLAKLRTVIDEKLSDTEVEPDATFILNELTSIEAVMEGFYRSNHGQVSSLQTVFIAQLRCLAYDIEDKIEFFEANKTTPEEFAQQIATLKGRSVETREQITSYMGLVAHGLTGTAQGADGTAQDPADVPTELQHLQVWLVRNLDCLLYLCLFPRDHHVRTEPLIRRWLAEGLVQREKNAVDNLEVLTNSNFMDSIQRSNNGKVKTCQTTHHMLEWISQKSMSQNFILFCDGRAEVQAEDARRLSVYPCANGEMTLPRNLSRIRTLAVFASGHANYEDVLKFAKYKVLRVLDLKECDNMSDDHLWAICDQVLMRYLSINLGCIDSITRRFGHMEQLETLDLSGSKTVTVYKEVLLLPKLKHLLGKFQLSMRDTPSVPILGWFQSKLERFLTSDSVLETLEGFVTGTRLGFPQLMSLMWRLRKVKIWCNSNASKKNLSALSVAITQFIHDETGQPDLSRSLSIDFQECSGDFLNTIQTDAKKKGKLTSLKLRGNLKLLSQFPQFIGQLRAVEELCLWSTRLSWQSILEGVGMLGILKYLKLIEDDLESIVIKPQHLKSIKRICFVSSTTLDITIQANALIHLVSLHIICQDLQVIPGTPGIEIKHMAGLKEVALHPHVKDNIKVTWEDAASSHDNKPDLLLIEGP